jgi:hypothetical protein
MLISRRDLILGSAIGASRILRAQSLSRYTLEVLNFSTTSTSFTASITKSGKTAIWAWGNGTYTTSNTPSHSYPAGTKTFRLITRDGFNGLTILDLSAPSMIGAFPSLARCPNLTSAIFNQSAFSGSLPSFAANVNLVTLKAYGNSFSGVLPSFATCTQLLTFYAWTNGFSGTLPSFAACTVLSGFDVHANAFTGTIPSFAACTNLTDFEVQTNQFTNVVPGSFATQKSTSISNFSGNALTQPAVDQILADFVTSLGISGRVHDTVNLTGGTNAAPSTTGLANAATLNTAGWTVTHN